MKKTITVRFGHAGAGRYWPGKGETWDDALGRAVRASYGRAASCWSVNQVGWNEDGETWYQATVVGPRNERAGAYPILDELHFSLDQDDRNDRPDPHEFDGYGE